MLEIYERIGIRGKLTGLLLVLLLVVAVNIVAVYYVQEETNEITDTIEVANKQSVLSQEIAFHSFRKAELENQGDQLQNAIVQYEQNLAVLENRTRGGETVGSVLQPGSVLGKARDELREQRRVWEEYSANARTIASEEPFNDEYTSAVDYVTENNQELDSRTQAIVDAYRSRNDENPVALEIARELQYHKEGMTSAVSQHTRSFTSNTLIENKLQDHIDSFDRLLGILENGGGYNGHTVKQAPPGVQDKLDRVRDIWPEFKGNAVIISNTSRLNSDFWTSLRFIETHNDELNNASATLSAEMNDIVHDRQNVLQMILVGLFVFNVAVALLGVVWVRRRVANPLETVTEKADQIANQNITVEIPETTRSDEVGRLFLSFEQMRSNIQANINSLRKAREDAEAAKQAAEQARDDAEQARLEAELLNEHLHVLDRLLRHNLKNDMNVIRLNAEMTRNEMSAEKTEYMDRIIEKSEELLRKTDKQRQITSTLTTESEQTDIDVAVVARSIVEDLSETYPEVTINLDTPESARVIAIETIEAAIFELVQNAIMHNDTADPVISVEVTCDEDKARVSVGDNGPTLPKVEQKVLRGNQDIDPLSHASGLGLWLVFWAVRQSKGQLQYEARQPQGNTVTIELQRAAHLVESAEVNVE